MGDESQTHVSGGEPIIEIGIGRIGHFPGGNVREQFNDLEELAASIKALGILQPLIVNFRDGRYVLVAGERRLRAAGLAGLTTVPCRVMHLSEDAALEAMLVENVQRSDLNPMEEARAYQRLMQMPGATQGSVAERVGKSRVHVVEHLQLLELPTDLQHQVATGALGIKTGLAFLHQTKQAPESVRQQVADKLKEQRPTTRQAPQVIDQVLADNGVARPPPPKPAPTAPPPEPAPAPAAPVDTQPPASAPEAAAPAPQPAAARVEPADEELVLADAQIGRSRWPALEGEVLVEIEALLPLAKILAHWQERMKVEAAYCPRGIGNLEIHIPEQGVWIRGRETALVKPPAQYKPEELAVTLIGEQMWVQCVGGVVKTLWPTGPVYYRVVIQRGKAGSMLRQQLVIPDGARRIVVTGADTLSIKPENLPALVDQLKRMGRA